MCCTSGWPIPVEQGTVGAIERVIASDQVPVGVSPWLVPQPDAPADVAGVLALRPNGHCVFFEAGSPGCAIHEAKPSACAHFPYVCLIDRRGVRVNLSHYCPTAASMLFAHTGPIVVVEGPRPVPDAIALEGLDARESLLPVAAGGSRLMSGDEFDAWERHRMAHARIESLQPDDVACFEHARGSVPAPWTWPPAPGDLESAWWSLVAPSWSRFDAVLSHFAAAKVFASWAAYQGEGIAAVERAARVAAAVLRVECVRACRDLDQPLDQELLKEAIRMADLLLVHYADPERLHAEPAAGRTT
jgi:Fe-S-cluster containining protein